MRKTTTEVRCDRCSRVIVEGEKWYAVSWYLDWKERPLHVGLEVESADWCVSCQAILEKKS